MADAGDVSTWAPSVLTPPATEGGVYPYSGFTQGWLNTGGNNWAYGYGGASEQTAPNISQYGNPVLRQNLCSNPSFEYSSPADPPVYNGATLTYVTDVTAFTGTRVARVTGGSASGLITLPGEAQTTALPGRVYSTSIYIRSTTVASQGKSVTMQALWYNSGTGLASGSSQQHITLTGAWQRVMFPNMTAPFAANSIGIMTTAPSGWTSTDTIDLDGLMLEPGATVGSYFDGNSPGASWVGVLGGTGTYSVMGSGAVVWDDQATLPTSDVSVMPMPDSTAAVVVAGDPNLNTYGITRTNLFPNPEFVGGTISPASYAVAGGAATLSYFATGGPTGKGLNGGPSPYVRMTWTTAPTTNVNNGLNLNNIPVNPGDNISASGWMRTSRTGVTLAIYIQFLNATGLNIQNVVVSFAPTVANQWWYYSATNLNAPAGTANVRVLFYQTAGSLWAVNDTWDFNGALVEKASSIGSYFDGASAGASWSGTANNSVSTLPAPTTLTPLYPGLTYTVSTSAYSPNVTTGNMACWQLVTNTVSGPGGATVTQGGFVSQDGAMPWSFTVPANTASAYLALVNLQTNPENIVRFTKPTISVMPSNAALGYLGTANAVPLRTVQIKMPTYYMSSGFPTGALYQLSGAPTMSWSQDSNSVQAPATPGDGTTVKTAADLRFLASQNYSQDAGTWSPWYSSGAHPMTLLAGVAPYYADPNDNLAYSYQFNSAKRINVASLLFENRSGTYMYSDDLNSLGLSQYTVIMVLGIPNNYQHGGGGIWGMIPKAAGGGPDTTADLDQTGVNWRSVAVSGPQLVTNSVGAKEKSFNFGYAPGLHKPTYLAFTFRNDANVYYYSDRPTSVLTKSVALRQVSGPLTGSVVLGGDVTHALQPATFNLMEMGVYFTALNAKQIQREIAILGQVYG